MKNHKTIKERFTLFLIKKGIIEHRIPTDEQKLKIYVEALNLIETRGKHCLCHAIQQAQRNLGYIGDESLYHDNNDTVWSVKPLFWSDKSYVQKGNYMQSNFADIVKHKPTTTKIEGFWWALGSISGYNARVDILKEEIQVLRNKISK